MTLLDNQHQFSTSILENNLLDINIPVSPLHGCFVFPVVGTFLEFLQILKKFFKSHFEDLYSVVLMNHPYIIYILITFDDKQ